MVAASLTARFIEPMLCFAADELPEGPAWQYEVKLDGYRAIGVRTKTGVEFWSRNKKDFSGRFPKVCRALEALPAETVVDGEIVALDELKDDRRSTGSRISRTARARLSFMSSTYRFLSGKTFARRGCKCVARSCDNSPRSCTARYVF
jgi:ATP-dependent DNA ligase